MMATIQNVLGMLIPNGGYVARGNEYEGIEFIECEPITKAQFTAGFAQYDKWKTDKEAQAAADKASATAKLEALGLTADDLTALGL
jgi:hypothetical protein